MDFINIPDIQIDFFNYDFDILLFLLNKRESGEICFEVSPCEILKFREKKELKRGGKNSCFSKNMLKSVQKSIQNLGYFEFINYYKYSNSYLILPKIFTQKKLKLPKNILSFNPQKELWEKIFAYKIYKFEKKQIQIKKLLKNVFISKNLKPYKIRNRFENALDNLSLKKIITSWHYQKINEEMLCKKEWLDIWQRLSVKIII